MIESYRDLRVWRKGMELSEEIYRLCKRLPAEERYGIAQQMKRASVSIPTNIAEGYGRRYLAEYLRFIAIANGSLKEVETLVLLSIRLNFIQPADAHRALVATDHLGKMFTMLSRRLSIKLANQRRDGHALFPTPHSLRPIDSSTHSSVSRARGQD